MKKLFFVYGSLKAGHWNNSVLGGSKLVGEAITKANFLLTNVGFPYMVPEGAHTGDLSAPTLPVAGEVYEVCCEDTEARLDALEGVRYNHYERRTILVNCEGEDIEVETYVPCDKEEAATQRVCNIVEMDGEEVYQWA